MFIARSILVFSTDVCSRRQAIRVCKALLQSGLVWQATIDLEDCDRVLRVVTRPGTLADIEKIVRAMGITLGELP